MYAMQDPQCVKKTEIRPLPRQLITTQQYVITIWGQMGLKRRGLAGEKFTGLLKQESRESPWKLVAL